MSQPRARPRLVIVSGLSGTGKSALAQALGRRLGLAVFSVDPIEAALLSSGIPRSFETGLAAYRVAQVLGDAQLGLGQGVIIDAVNAEEEGKAVWRELGLRRRVPLRVILCVCSPAGLHRQRLESRRRGLPHVPEPTWADVEARRRAFTPWWEPHLLVDAADPLERNVERALRWLRALRPPVGGATFKPASGRPRPAAPRRRGSRGHRPA